MIPTLIILLILGGGGGGLDLSDPAVLAKFQQNVGTIVQDPGRVSNVIGAVSSLNAMSRQSDNLIQLEIQEFRMAAGNYQATRAEVDMALRELEGAITQKNIEIINAREVMRQNTTKKEWKKLLKSLKKD